MTHPTTTKRSKQARERASRRARGTRTAVQRSRAKKGQQGFALLLAIIAIAILSVLITDLHETTGTSFAAAMAAKDQLRAEFMAKSGVNLTRMLVGQERNLRKLVDPLYRQVLKRGVPQIPVWQFANVILRPFADFEGSKEDVAGAGYDLDLSEGLGATFGSFEVKAVAENGMINVNDPRIEDPATGHANVAAQVYSLMGGFQPSPNKFDPLFSQFDERGRITTRLDVVSNVIDWWDRDEQRTNWDPVLGTVTSGGGEDTDYYRSLPDPYAIKNAPFDTLEELRLVRGISDDFWATFVEPSIEDPRDRQVTIYGQSRVNPNEAKPEVILARLCTFKEVREQLLCSDPTGQEPIKFIMLMGFARTMAQGFPFFSRAGDFVNFITGKPESLYDMVAKYATSMPMLQNMLFAPVAVEDADVLRGIRRTFTTTTNFITVDVTGRSGNSQRRIRTVINIDTKWTPPPPNAGQLPPLGIFSYYRID
jgi:general secretion pathway protein K